MDNTFFTFPTDIPNIDTIRNTIVRYSIILSISATLTYIGFLLIYDFAQFFNFTLILILLLIPQFISIWLLSKNKNNLSKVIFLSGNILTITLVSQIFLGSDSGMQLLLIFTMVFPVFIWSYKDRLYCYILAFISFSLYIYLEFFSVTDNVLIQLSGTMKHYLILSIIITCIISVTIVLMIYQIIAEKNENQVKAQSDELKKFIIELTQKRDELHRLNVSKNKLFSIVAHDLKSPFNTIIGFSELLVNQWEVFNEEKKIKFAKLILDSSETAFGLLENLLAWSRMQNKGIVSNPDNINLFQIIQQIMLIYKNISEQKNIKIINELSPNHSVYADNYMISTVFRNFLSNAIKFTQRNGTITISAVTADKSHLNISICDTGVGMNANQINSIFNLEKNISTIGTANEKGTGLGLPLCKDFIEQNNGKIIVKSKKGEGSTFSVSLRTSA